MKKAFAIAFAAAILAASCASYRVYYVTETPKVDYAAALTGKTLAIKPVQIKFYNSRMVLADSVMAGDVYVQRYATTEESMEFGAKVGILQRNIFQNAKVDASQLAYELTGTVASAAVGAVDYRLVWATGFAPGQSGELSNRPIEYDTTTWPYVATFLPATGPTSYFSDIFVVGYDAGAENADFTLEVQIDVDNEIQEIIGVPSTSGFGDTPKQGDYYVHARASLRFYLTNARTNEVVVSYKSNFAYPVDLSPRKYYKLPIDRPADFYRLEKFLTLDYTPYASDIARLAIEGLAPYIAPFVVNVMQMEEIKEEAK
jgi:hypothetical protein